MISAGQPVGFGELNAAVFLTFLDRLSRDAGRKGFLIIDDVIVHDAAPGAGPPQTACSAAAAAC